MSRSGPDITAALPEQRETTQSTTLIETARELPTPPCAHCGNPAVGAMADAEAPAFCCNGCKTVHELLHYCGLDGYYRMAANPGLRVEGDDRESRYSLLDDPEIASQVADRLAPDFGSVRLRLPNIHCIACVWLLENLHRIRSGIGTCRVDFLRREVHVAFDPRAVSLAQIAATLASIGYPPDLRLSDLRGRMHASPHRRLWMKLGVAGFAFGNAMLLSFSHYLGLDALSAPDFQRLAAIVSFLLAIPVTFFCAEDYWKAAWISIRQRRLNLEVPIALGIAALFLQSAFDTWTGRGEGYFDSLAGLLFFLLIGRTFQTIIHDRLTFDRGLSDFLPLSSIRLRSDGSEETVAIDALNPGDMIRVRHGEWVPCDSTLAEGPGSFDLSFITGEANAAPIQRGEAVPAGARQVAGSVLLRVSKRVSQGYLASLWQQDAFRRERDDHARSATQRFSQRFTKIVLAVATVSGLFWSFQDPGMGLETFLAVLIVACPCALALAAPFALGTARRCLTQRGIHLRTVEVLETLAEVDTVVFDKTGTLTLSGAADVKWAGSPITPDIAKRLALLASQSAHPLAVCIQGALRNMGFDVAMDEGDRQAGPRVAEFREFTGLGIEAKVDGHKLRMGSARFVGKVPESAELEERQTCVHVQIDGKQVGCFVAGLGLRPGAAEVLKALGKDRTTQLLSGDNDHEQDRFRRLFPPSSPLLFRQSPHSKLDHVRSLQAQGRTVMMVGDGLNDAGALRQSDVGVVVLDDLGAFSPSSDLIVKGDSFRFLAGLLEYSRACARILKQGFLVSGAYNVLGVAIAASGQLSPIVCAVLMPLSSLSVCLFVACAAQHRAAQHLGPIGARVGAPRPSNQLHDLVPASLRTPEAAS